MGNKNQHVVIAYFASAAAADTAAASLKAWDKATDAVKLGGVGVLTYENGAIKTEQVGARATGTGTKWGTILGAAMGILSGGVSLIGGMLAGAGIGAVSGALFHKRLGLSDEDKARLEGHLKNGGAAIVAMADEDEVEPTKAELAKLGGAVESYQVPAEHVEALQTALPADGEAEAKPAAPEAKPEAVKPEAAAPAAKPEAAKPEAAKPEAAKPAKA